MGCNRAGGIKKLSLEIVMDNWIPLDIMVTSVSKSKFNINYYSYGDVENNII